MNGLPDELVRREVADACLILAESGHEHFFLGHVSARASQPGAYWVKPTGLGLAEVGADDLVLADLDGRRLAGEQRLHQESPIHGEIYRARPDVAAVVHTHPPNVAAFAASDAEFLVVSQDSVLFVDGLGRYDDPTLVVTPEQGRALAASLGSCSVVVMRNHGLTVAAGSVRAAVVLAVSFERSLETQRRAAGFGSVRAIEPQHAADMAASFEASSRGRIDAMYEWLLRRARSSVNRR